MDRNQNNFDKNHKLVFVSAHKSIQVIATQLIDGTYTLNAKA